MFRRFIMKKSAQGKVSIQENPEFNKMLESITSFLYRFIVVFGLSSVIICVILITR